MDYQIGQKVKYRDNKGKEAIGIVHGIQNHESPEGLVLKRNYLIDTGNVIREDVVEVDKKGKPTKVVHQPEQILLSEERIEAI